LRLAEAEVLRDTSVEALIRTALAEDIGEGDITSAAVIAEDQTCLARIKAKSKGVLAGIRVAEAVFHMVDRSLEFEADSTDGARLLPGDTVAVVGGRARAVLAAERTALNFLQHLSGIATATAEVVRVIDGSGVRVLDTRKTTPGLRELEKYAVQVGGGVNHRHGLYDAFLIKENHIRLAGDITGAVQAARASGRQELVVEVRNREELEEAIAAQPDRIMLDNFSPMDAAEAVERVARRCPVEISGGVTIDNIRAYAAAHPTYISVGFITHSAPVLDLSLTVVA
jgi:nicotinate-nucleotide pyrophosphorylase (carboxylating)